MRQPGLSTKSPDGPTDQELRFPVGKQTWDVASGPDGMGLNDVESAIPLALAELDTGCFRVRVDKTTEKERESLLAMARLGPGPYQSADAATALGRRVGPIRDSLIRRGLCCAPRGANLPLPCQCSMTFAGAWLSKSGPGRLGDAGPSP